MARYEAAGAAVLGGIAPFQLSVDDKGAISLDDLKGDINLTIRISQSAAFCVWKTQSMAACKIKTTSRTLPLLQRVQA